jgi:hypothetical protein
VLRRTEVPLATVGARENLYRFLSVKTSLRIYFCSVLKGMETRRRGNSKGGQAFAQIRLDPLLFIHWSPRPPPLWVIAKGLELGKAQFGFM